MELFRSNSQSILSVCNTLGSLNIIGTIYVWCIVQHHRCNVVAAHCRLFGQFEHLALCGGINCH